MNQSKTIYHTPLHLFSYFAFGSVLIASSNEQAIAQSNIVPDNSLGNESSIVNSNFNGLPVEVITGGAQRGQNLFHSFQEFNVSEGRGAYFNSPNADIINILSRVTGNNISEILGTLGTFGQSQPNLFLINPNGIVFGENASLDIGGSFVGSTANSILFPEGEFSATDGQTKPLLTINMPIGLGFQDIPGDIINRSVGENPNGETNVTGGAVGLQVPIGETLAIVGGNVLLNDGNLTAKGGHIEIGSIQGIGTVGISETPAGWVFNYDSVNSFGEIRLDNTAVVDVTAVDGGSINFNANNINIVGGSSLNGGIGFGLGSTNSQAGDISLSATGNIAIDNSLVFNQILPNGTGKGGNLVIDTNNLSVTNGGQAGVLTFGNGNTGNIIINASESILLDSGETGFLTGILAQVVQSGAGNVGNANIETKQLDISNGAQISVSNFGEGNTGNLTINSSDSIAITGSGNFVSGILNQGGLDNGSSLNLTTGTLDISDGGQITTNSFGTGNASDLDIRATSVSLTNNSLIDTSAFGNGNSGNVEIKATDSVSLDNSSIFASVGQNSIANAGNISIQASQDILLVNSLIASNILSEAAGNVGTITLSANSILLTDDSQLQAGFFAGGKGEKGAISIQAIDSFVLDNSSIFGDVQTEAIGNSSDVNILGDSVTLTNNSTINTSNAGLGNSGNVEIAANTISLTNGASIDAKTSGQENAGNVFLSATELVSLANGAAINVAGGRGGDIVISSQNLEITNNSSLTTGIQAGFVIADNQGDIVLNASESVMIDGSLIFNLIERESVGNNGNIEITTSNLKLLNNAAINNGNFGRGNSGDITINVDSLEQSFSVIATAIFNQGNAGDININAANNILLTDISSIESKTRDNAIGNSGNISIKAQNLNLDDTSSLVTSVEGEGNTGSISIDTVDLGNLDNNSIISTNNSGTGNAGEILLKTGFFSLNNNSRIFTTVSNNGNAGNITIDASNDVFLSNNSFILSSTLDNQVISNSGNIQINAQNLILNDASLINSLRGQGNAGAIKIGVIDTVEFNNSFLRSEVLLGGIGNAGNIEISAGNIFLSDDTILSTTVEQQGNAGNITLKATDTFSANNSLINSNIGTSEGNAAMGNVGSILVEAKNISLSDTAQLQAGLFSGATGELGIISLKAEDNISFTGSDTGIFGNTETGSIGNSSDVKLSATSISLDNGAVVQASTRGDGKGGNIEIDSNRLELDNSSQIFAATLGEGDAGNINITTGNLTVENGASISSSTAPNSTGKGGKITIVASDVIELSGTITTVEGAIASSISTQTQGTGNGGEINITTEKLIITEGAEVNANSVFNNSGKAGNLTVKAFDSIELIGGTELTPSGLSVDTSSSQNAGDLEITTEKLIVRDGAQISTATFGAGNAGNLIIDATDIQVIGETDDQRFNSTLSASVQIDATGNGGGINITTERLSVTDGAVISAETLGLSQSRAGTMKINATESVELTGTGGLLVKADNGATAGNLDLETGKLNIADGASITVSSTDGQAGNVSIKTNSLSQNGGDITALTGTSGEKEGANINLQIADLWTLENNSQVSATASGSADGGNIEVDTEFIIAFPDQNNDITANASEGRGGNINITTEGIFGLEERSSNPPNQTNDIDASSQFGLNGSISIETPDVNPANSLVALPTNIIDASQLITKNCLGTVDSANQESEFVVTGRGGLPTNPTETLRDNTTLSTEWLTLKPETNEAKQKEELVLETERSKTDQIIEAKGWIFGAEGQIILTANPPASQNQASWQVPHSCSSF